MTNDRMREELLISAPNRYHEEVNAAEILDATVSEAIMRAERAGLTERQIVENVLGSLLVRTQGYADELNAYHARNH